VNNSVVVIKASVKRITLQRGICSEIAYGLEPSLGRIHVLFQNQLWLERKCSTDKKFAEKFGQSLEDLSIILKQTNLSRGLTSGAVNGLKQRLQHDLESFLYPKRNLTQISLKVSQSFYTKPYTPPGVDTKLLPPKRFIGIGYRDKGTARIPHLDGSPRWQEVASRASNLERRIHETREKVNVEGNEVIERLRLCKELMGLKEELRKLNSSVSDSGDAKKSQRSES
jgi:hypothetical protein